MSRRFGRNQRRAMLAQIAAADARAVEAGKSAAGYYRDMVDAHDRMNRWLEQIRHVVGKTSLFEPTVPREHLTLLEMPSQVTFRASWGNALGLAGLGPSSVDQVLQALVVRLKVMARDDGGKLSRRYVVKLMSRNGDSAYAFDMTTLHECGFGPREVNDLSQEIARQLAIHYNIEVAR